VKKVNGNMALTIAGDLYNVDVVTRTPILRIANVRAFDRELFVRGDGTINWNGYANYADGTPAPAGNGNLVVTGLPNDVVSVAEGIGAGFGITSSGDVYEWPLIFGRDTVPAVKLGGLPSIKLGVFGGYKARQDGTFNSQSFVFLAVDGRLIVADFPSLANPNGLPNLTVNNPVSVHIWQEFGMVLVRQMKVETLISTRFRPTGLRPQLMIAKHQLSVRSNN
jgi:hypothetical protein